MDEEIKKLALSMHALELASEAWLENAVISAAPKGLEEVITLADDIRTRAHAVVGNASTLLTKLKP